MSSLRRQKSNTLTVHTRVKEYEGIFRADNGLLFCNYCDLSVEWKHKSTVDAHCTSKKHLAQQKLYESKEKNKNQQTLQASLSAAESKKKVISDLIEAFTSADIPLEKVNSLIPFFKKYLKEGGAIPQAPTLRQLYLPEVFNKHIDFLKSIFDSKPVCIIMDETSDNCARNVVNTLFTYHSHTKLVSVDFLTSVNNSTIAQTLLPILHFYNIPLNTPYLFLSDSASYMKKCYNDVLKPIMPQLIHLPCPAHILNLIGETWQNLPQFSLLKFLLSKIKDFFTKSPARKNRYLAYLYAHGILSPCKIPLPTKTRWNSWFKMVFYTKEYLQYWQGFFKIEFENDPTNGRLDEINQILQDIEKFGSITIYTNFISIYAKPFIHDLDFFQQQNKPVFPYAETRFENLTAYLESNRVATHFGTELETLISNLFFNPLDFYSIFRAAFQAAYDKFLLHIPNHPARPLFRAMRIFNPKFIQTGNIERRNIWQYSIIQELNNPSDDLIHEWGIYCGLESDINENELDVYWNNMTIRLPVLSQIAFNYIWLPVSSCAVERSFSLYSTLLDDDRQNLSKESLKQLSMMYFNRD